MTRILVVDDEARYQKLLRVNLEPEGYEVITASNGQEALEAVSTHHPDLVILDIMMPILDGIAACERIREFSNVPVIILTAKGEESDRVAGFNVGADDYVVKPFSATELVARVRAVLRRTQTSEQVIPNRYFIHGNLKIDFARAEVWKDNNAVSLSATEYKLLIQFANNVGEVLTGEKLLTTVWGPGYGEDKEILWVSIARLRQKLEDKSSSHQHIVTRTGLGYIMPQLEDDENPV
jgi:DNA-binding response OmpR family regulator